MQPSPGAKGGLLKSLLCTVILFFTSCVRGLHYSSNLQCGTTSGFLGAYLVLWQNISFPKQRASPDFFLPHWSRTLQKNPGDNTFVFSEITHSETSDCTERKLLGCISQHFVIGPCTSWQLFHDCPKAAIWWWWFPFLVLKIPVRLKTTCSRNWLFNMAWRTTINRRESGMNTQNPTPFISNMYLCDYLFTHSPELGSRFLKILPYWHRLPFTSF